MDYAQYSNKWQERFRFFDAHGGPNHYAYHQALRALPVLQRMRHSFNLWSLFFPLFYFVVVGCWRKSLSLIGIVLMLGLVLSLVGASAPIFNAVAAGISVVCGMAGNYARYLKVKGQGTGWNPFEGMPLFGPKKDKA